MKKALKHYLFPLCVLILGGFVNIYADSQNNNDTENADYGTGGQHFNHASVDSSQTGIEKNLFIEVNDTEEQEERDEELASHNTDLRYGSYLTAFFYASATGRFFRELKRNLGFFEPSSITALFKRHIRFQVFRI